jgi:predicted O-linked N-acetylglucosamine transferase (SPINDLY family)/predicted 2-oxoglutarate/Fe(II)-dependent dioxygenase YbiX
MSRSLPLTPLPEASLQLASDAVCLNGLRALQQGKLTEALTQFQQAIALEPERAEFYVHLGVAHCRQANFELGVAAYEQALALQPERTEARYNLALALEKLGQSEAALQQYQVILQQHPDQIATHYQIGNLYQKQSWFQTAIAAYHQAIERLGQPGLLSLPINQIISVRPDAVWYNLGVAQQKLHDLPAAESAYRRALTLNPNYVEAHNALAALIQPQDHERALVHYQQALIAAPNYLPALINLGNLYLQQQDWQSAEAAFQRVLQQDPQQLKAIDGLLSLRLLTANWSDLALLTEKLWTIGQNRIGTELSLYQTLFLPLTAAQQQTLAQNYAQAIEHKVAAVRQQLNFSFSTAAKPRLRLGYLSGDFRYQAVGSLILRLFELHDRQQFEVYAYSLGENDRGSYRRKFEADSDCFRDVAQLDSVAIAQQIYADEIDILIDLEGYTQFARPEICALRPAPLIISYLGHSATYGSEYIDYMLTDPVVTSSRQTQWLTEACLYLPDSYLLNSPQEEVAPPRPRSVYGLPEAGFVFRGFHKIQKISPDLFAVWMRILQRVPNSVLWLAATNSVAQANLIETATAVGVSSNRLIFTPMLPEDEYRSSHQCADLYLDAFYHTAAVTGIDALWAGLPILTLAGETCASRLTASSLMAVNLPELITTSLEAYEQRAVELATHPEQLQVLRQRLVENRSSCYLFNTKRTVRHLEAAYRLAWENYQAGDPPQSMQVTALSDAAPSQPASIHTAIANTDSVPSLPNQGDIELVLSTASQPVASHRTAISRTNQAVNQTLPKVPMGWCILDVLTAEELTQLRALLANAQFIEGKLTAIGNADIKHNKQLSPSDQVETQVKSIVIAALARNLQFQQFACPKIIRPPLFSRYLPGMAYGSHIDNPLMGEMSSVRSDLSITLFLSEPESYEGGELVIEAGQSEYPVKLPAGAMVLYPTTYLHRVEPVTRGERLAAVTWVQSLLRRTDEREIIADLAQVQQLLLEKYGRTRAFDLISKTSANLLRKWAET